MPARQACGIIAAMSVPIAATRTVPARPRLSEARVPLWTEVEVLERSGAARRIGLPAERALTLYVDRHELVTLMTLGQRPEWLALGWLLNQGLVRELADVESVDVDWDVGAAAVRMRRPIARLTERTARRTVTTGCGQGTVYGELLAQLDGLPMPAAGERRWSGEALGAMVESARALSAVHRLAGSVHGCGLFDATQALLFIEDVGRHNAIDTIAGWMALNGVAGAGKAFYTTGRLTSEMVLKAARMGLGLVVSRNGATLAGLELAQRLGLTLIGRASPHRFLCYTGAQRLDFAAAGHGAGAEAANGPDDRD